MRRVVFAIALSLLAGMLYACSQTPDDTATEGSTTDEPEKLDFSEVFSGASGSGSGEARAIVSANPQVITSEREVAGLVIERTEPSDPVYVAVFIGQRSTGGFSVAINDVERDGETVRVVVEETEPPDGFIVSQALTYPVVVVSTSDITPDEIPDLTFEFVAPDGENLDLPTDVSGE